jgi:hypothetical protein
MEDALNKIPDHLRPRNKGTDQIFKNRWLEIFTRTHISIPVTIHLIVCVGVSYIALQQHSVLLFVLLFGTGWLFWTFSEYWIHRYVYHVKTDNKLLLKISACRSWHSSSISERSHAPGYASVTCHHSGDCFLQLLSVNHGKLCVSIPAGISIWLCSLHFVALCRAPL